MTPAVSVPRNYHHICDVFTIPFDKSYNHVCDVVTTLVSISYHCGGDVLTSLSGSTVTTMVIMQISYCMVTFCK